MMIVIGSLAIIIISILIGLVYLRNPKYAFILATIAIVFIAINTFWSLNDDKFEEATKNRIKLSEVTLDEQKLSKGYANRYLYSAMVTNRSKYRLTSLKLNLDIISEETGQQKAKQKVSNQQTIKLHVLPTKSKPIKVYFESDSAAQEITEKTTWQVKIQTIRSK